MVSSGVRKRIAKSASYLHKIARRNIYPHEQVELSQKAARLSSTNDEREDEKRH
jgi:hypothetical protein